MVRRVEGRPPLYAILCTSSCICVYRSSSNTLRAQLAYELLALWRLGTQGDHFLPKSNYRHMKRGSPSFVYAIWFIFTRRRWSTWWSLVNDRMLNLRYSTYYGKEKTGCDAKIDFSLVKKKLPNWWCAHNGINRTKTKVLSIAEDDDALFQRHLQ